MYVCVRESVWLEHTLRVDELGPERGHDAGMCKHVHDFVYASVIVCVLYLSVICVYVSLVYVYAFVMCLYVCLGLCG